MPVTHDLSATGFIGRPVRNSAGETLGRIEDLVLNSSGGGISFAILSLTGMSRIGDRLVAVPWGKFAASPGRDYLLVDVGRNILESAPTFERTSWPDWSDAGWRSRIYTHYGYRDPVVVHDHRVVVDRQPRRSGISFLAAAFLLLLLVGALGFTYLVATRGWEEAKAEMIGSMHGVTYAMKDVSSDAALTAKVKTALSLNRRVPAEAINVDSENGIVTLRGEVFDDQTHTTVISIARDTPGVQEVKDHLFVESHSR